MNAATTRRPTLTEQQREVLQLLLDVDRDPLRDQGWVSTGHDTVRSARVAGGQTAGSLVRHGYAEQRQHPGTNRRQVRLTDTGRTRAEELEQRAARSAAAAATAPVAYRIVFDRIGRFEQLSPIELTTVDLDQVRRAGPTAGSDALAIAAALRDHALGRGRHAIRPAPLVSGEVEVWIANRRDSGRITAGGQDVGGFTVQAVTAPPLRL